MKSICQVGCLTKTFTELKQKIPFVNEIKKENKKFKKIQKFIFIEETTPSFNFFLNRNEKLELELIKVKDLGNGKYETNNNSLICDFSTAEFNYKQKYGYHLDSPNIKSITSKQKKISETKVLDCTAGLGKDSFIFASFGFQVLLIEKNPIIFQLLQDGHQRGMKDEKISNILKNMKLVNDDSIDYLNSHQEHFDVIYFDPMFPSMNRKNKISPKKEIQYIREIVQERETNLLEKAKEFMKFTDKLVIKRPKNVEPLSMIHFSYEMKSTRFDVIQKTSLL
jgi:16S rRNA (guanine1516-N2)-methyltransferase